MHRIGGWSQQTHFLPARPCLLWVLMGKYFNDTHNGPLSTRGANAFTIWFAEQNGQEYWNSKKSQKCSKEWAPAGWPVANWQDAQIHGTRMRNGHHWRCHMMKEAQSCQVARVPLKYWTEQTFGVVTETIPQTQGNCRWEHNGDVLKGSARTGQSLFSTSGCLRRKRRVWPLCLEMLRFARKPLAREPDPQLLSLR